MPSKHERAAEKLSRMAALAHRRAMKNVERREATVESCVVCGAADPRTLSHTRLADGARVVVCGSHKIAHRKSERIASSVAELVALTGERRKIAV